MQLTVTVAMTGSSGRDAGTTAGLAAELGPLLGDAAHAVSAPKQAKAATLIECGGRIDLVIARRPTPMWLHYLRLNQCCLHLTLNSLP